MAYFTDVTPDEMGEAKAQMKRIVDAFDESLVVWGF
jgi:hypothetical protein